MNTFYKATIVDTIFRDGEYLHQLVFDDGDVFWYNLFEVFFIFKKYSKIATEYSRMGLPLAYPTMNLPHDVAFEVVSKVRVSFSVQIVDEWQLKNWLLCAKVGKYLERATELLMHNLYHNSMGVNATIGQEGARGLILYV